MRRKAAPAAAEPAAAPEPRPPTYKVWLLASRPNTLSEWHPHLARRSSLPVALTRARGPRNRPAASFTPVLVGAALAARDGYRRPGLAFLFWLFAGCVQIGTNLHNDYADFVRGADTSARVGQARAAQKGWLTPAAVCWGTCTVLSVAAIIGGALAAGVAGAARPAMPMTIVTVTSVFNAFAYTGGPFPLGCDFLARVHAAARSRAPSPCEATSVSESCRTRISALPTYSASRERDGDHAPRGGAVTRACNTQVLWNCRDVRALLVAERGRSRAAARA